METIFQLNIMHEVELETLKMHMYALIKTPPHPHVHAHVCFWSDPLPLTAYILYGCPLRCSRPFNSITRPVTKSMVVVFANSVKKLKGFTRWGDIKRKDQGCTSTDYSCTKWKVYPYKCSYGGVCGAVTHWCRQGFWLKIRVHSMLSASQRRQRTIKITLHPLLLLPA